MSQTETLTAIPLPNLIPHGGHIRAQYRDGAWGASTDAERPEGGLTGTLKRFKKNIKAAQTPQAYGWIKAIYPDAIEYSGMKQQVEGMIMAGAFLGVMIGGAMLWGGGYQLVAFERTIFSVLLSLLWIIAGFAVSAWMILTPLRRVWRAPRDLPVIFDRAHRKVYRIVLDSQPGLKGLLKPWPVLAVAYDWNLLDAEHDARTIGSAATVTRLHRLVIVVRKSADDPTIIDHFEIGNGMSQSEEMVAPMWEHIRRFMEAKGPALPDPAEPLDSRADEQPTWWQACGQAGPFGSRYVKWWEEQTFLTAFYHLVAGTGLTLFAIGLWNGLGFGSTLALTITWLIISINWGQGTGIWLQAHTSRLYDWPKTVKDAVGTAIRRGAGW